MKEKVKTVLCIVLAGLLVVESAFLAYGCFHRNEHKKTSTVVLGIENLDENLSLFQGKRVGLITNATGTDSHFRSSIDILKEKVNLTELFAPEHGIRGSADAGATVGDEKDKKTGLPVHSLYGNTKKPTEEMLQDVDLLAYDIQDVGTRFYTYISTLYYGMQAAAEKNIPFVVFDRPDPISGDQVEGNVLSPGFESFIGITNIPQRYGLTCGELATFMNEKNHIQCQLQVIKMKNWTRNMYFDDTGLNTWIMPSPNMPTLDTAVVYPGTGLFEGTNVSEGRGTTRPFEIIGAPWIDGQFLADEMNQLNLPGVYFRSISFTPTASKFQNEPCQGVEIHVTDRVQYQSVRTGIELVSMIQKDYPNDFHFLETNTIDQIFGSDALKNHKYTVEELLKMQQESAAQFQKETKEFYMYS